MTQQTHDLKTWPEYFRKVQSGDKLFELRYNDRNFQEGDFVRLQEFDPCRSCMGKGKVDFRVADKGYCKGFECPDCNGTGGKYTGQGLMFTIAYILASHPALRDNNVVISLKPYTPEFKPLVSQPTEATRATMSAALYRMAEWIAKGGRLVQGSAKAGAPHPGILRIQMDMTVARPDEDTSKVVIS